MDWTPLSPELMKARECANTFAAWLYDKSNDELRLARPMLDAAEAVAPFAPICMNPTSGNVEY